MKHEYHSEFTLSKNDIATYEGDILDLFRDKAARLRSDCLPYTMGACRLQWTPYKEENYNVRGKLSCFVFTEAQLEEILKEVRLEEILK